MRTSGFWALFAVAFFLLTRSSCIPDSSTMSASSGDVKALLSNRKLKEMMPTFNTATTMCDSSGNSMDDYPGHDPSPSSKVDAHPGPIVNGKPVMPYFTRPSPPPPPRKVSP